MTPDRRGPGRMTPCSFLNEMHVLALTILMLVAPIYSKASPQAPQSLPSHVEVFVNQPADVVGRDVLEQHGIRVSVHDLSELEQIQKQLSDGLPGRQADAQRLAMQRIEDAKASLGDNLGRAWRSRVRARELGITQVPATVIGTTTYYTGDLVRAVRAWQQSRGVAR